MQILLWWFIVALATLSVNANAVGDRSATALERVADRVHRWLAPTKDPCDNFYDFVCGGYPNVPEYPHETELLKLSTADIKEYLNADLLALITAPDAQPNERQSIRIAKKYFSDCMAAIPHAREDASRFLKLLNVIGGWPFVEFPIAHNKTVEPIRIGNWRQLVAGFAEAGFKMNHLADVRVVSMDGQSGKSIYITPPGVKSRFQLRTPTSFIDSDLPRIYDLLGSSMDSIVAQIDSSNKFISKLTQIIETISEAKSDDSPAPMNEQTLGEIQLLYPHIDLENYINSLLIFDQHLAPSDKVLLVWPEYFERLNALLRETDELTVANLLVHKSLENLGFQDVIISQTVGRNTTWPSFSKLCLGMTKLLVAPVLDSLYVRDHQLSNRTFDAINQLVDHVRHALPENVSERFKSINRWIGYPKELLDDAVIDRLYDGVDLEELTFAQSSVVLGRNMFRHLNMTWFGASLSTTELLSVFSANDINIPAGLLQGALFSVDHPSYMNYAAIGVNIGRKICQKFPDPLAGSPEHLACYSQLYEPFANDSFAQNHLDVIADTGEVHLLYSAYRTWVAENQPEPTLPGLPYSPEQLFWISYGQMLCGKTHKSWFEKPVFLLEDTNPPSRKRVLLPLLNSDAFAKDFNCPAGSPMNPVSKCDVWYKGL